MNGAGQNRYHSSFEKISKKLRLLFPCNCCGNNEFSEKEVHHIDENKRNGALDNLVVLCRECHSLLHTGRLQLNGNHQKLKENIVLLGYRESWINRNSKIKIIVLKSEIALDFRKKYIKGWVVPGACNLYIGLLVDELLIGVLGFSSPEMGNYDLLLKADTIDSRNRYAIDLLLYCLRAKETKVLLERRFNRKIDTIYSMCFSPHNDISRYRKHGELTKKVELDYGYNIGYTFKAGSIPSLKSAVSEFFQKHKDL